MKLHNRKTGEVLRFNKDWEIYNPNTDAKPYYFIHNGQVMKRYTGACCHNEWAKERKKQHNYFTTEEKALKALAEMGKD